MTARKSLVLQWKINSGINKFKLKSNYKINDPRVTVVKINNFYQYKNKRVKNVILGLNKINFKDFDNKKK